MKPVILFGTDLCPRCIEVKKALDDASVKYTYVDVCSSMMMLKRGLTIREKKPALAGARAEHRMGIPFLMVGKDVYPIAHEGEIVLPEIE